MLAAAVDTLRADRPGVVAGRYLPTDRNGLVATLFPDHGFEPASPNGFELPADRAIAIPDHITLLAT